MIEINAGVLEVTSSSHGDLAAQLRQRAQTLLDSGDIPSGISLRLQGVMVAAAISEIKELAPEVNGLLAKQGAPIVCEAVAAAGIHAGLAAIFTLCNANTPARRKALAMAYVGSFQRQIGPILSTETPQ